MFVKNLKIGIGLISYNQENYIEDAINSIFRQTWLIDRLVICDDCSTDGTWEKINSTVKQWKSRSHNVREVITRRNKKNLGYLKNFQQVVRLAGGDLFVYQAGDDESLPHRVEKLVQAYVDAGRPAFALLHSSVYVNKIDPSTIWKAPSSCLSTLKDFALSLALHIGATEAFDPRLLLDFGEIEGHTYDELILGFRAAMLGSGIAIEEPLLIYRTGGLTSSTGNKDPDYHWRHAEATYRQRLRDAKFMGQRFAEEILEQSLIRLGCVVDRDDEGRRVVSPHKNPASPSGWLNFDIVQNKIFDEDVGCRKMLRILIISDAKTDATDYVYRLARFDMLKRSGVDVDIVWFDEEYAQTRERYDIYWIFGFPAGSKFLKVLKSLEEFRNTCVFWEIDRWLDDKRACEDASIACRYVVAQRMLMLCSVVVASDEYLARWIRFQSLTEVLVLPDLIPAASLIAVDNYEAIKNEKQVTLKIGLRSKNWSAELWGFVEKLLWAVTSRLSNVSIVIFGAAPDTVRGVPCVTVINTSLADIRWFDRIARECVDIALLPILRSEMLVRPILRDWLEWAASGAAVIVSRMPRLDEAIQDDLFVSVPNDIESWCAAIQQCLENPTYRTSIAERALAYVRENHLLHDSWLKNLEYINQALQPKLRIPRPKVEVMAEPRLPSDVGWLFNAESYRRWCRARELREVDGETLAERVVAWKSSPHVLYITVASTAEDFTLLSVTAASLGAQFYDGWRWVILSDRSVIDPVFEDSDRLIWWQLPTLDSPDAVPTAIFEAIDKFDADWVCLLLPGAYVHPHAAIEVIDRGFFRENVCVVYPDHDHWDESEILGEGVLDFEWISRRRCDPYFKPDLDRLWLLQADYIGAAVWWRSDFTRQFKNHALPGAWWYGAVVAASKNVGAVIHIPEILMTLPLRGSTELQSLARPVRQIIANRVVRDWFAPISIDLKLSICRRTLHLDVSSRPLAISVVFVIQDVHFQCRETIEALRRQLIDDDDLEIIVVANHVRDPDTRSLLDDWRNSQAGIYVIDDDEDYDLVRLYSLGSSHAKKDIIVFMHADVVPVDRRLFWRLARDVLLTDGGMVGPLLLRPETMVVDSAGIAPGGPGVWQVSHVLGEPFTLFDDGPWDLLRVMREVPAVDPVVFAMRRETWRNLTDLVGQFTVPHHIAAQLALRIREQGGRVLITPYARAAHRRGSCDAYLLKGEAHIHRRFMLPTHEAQRFWRRYGVAWSRHPAWPRALSLRHDGWQLDQVAPILWPLENARRVRILGYSVGGGSGEYRVKSPLWALGQAGLAYTEVVNERKPDLLRPAELLRLQPDTILLHQWIGRATVEAIDSWREVDPDVRIVLGLDDRNDAVPEKSNLYGAYRRAHPDARAKLRRVAERCNAVIVSTPPLQAMLDELGVCGPAVHVIPNALERDRWYNLHPPRRKHLKPRVGWIGALQHRGDLEFLIPVIKATHDKVDWVFMGMVLPEVQEYVREFHEWVSFDRYPGAIADLDLDLAVAPLAHNIFNECKSNLRLLEYGAASYPVICTDITPYRENSPPVTRLDNQADLWIDAIRTAVDDIDALRVSGDALRQWVWAHYDLASHVASWHRALAGEG